MEENVEPMVTDPLERLRVGLLFKQQELELSEPQNYVLDSHSPEAVRWQTLWQYAAELCRVLEELSITVNQITSIDLDSQTGIHPEDLIVYYQGIFLDQLHRAKDKIFRLFLLTAGMKHDEKIKFAKFLTKQQALMDSIGVTDELRLWDDENRSSVIAFALKKRTEHHHHISKLSYDDSFTRVKASRAMSVPAITSLLNDFGKAELERWRVEHLASLKSEAIRKADTTLGHVKECVALITEKLTAHLKLDYSKERAAEIFEKHQKLDASLVIKNESSLEKVHPALRETINRFMSALDARYSGQYEAAYLVGSVGRGDFDVNYSDINIVVVFGDSFDLDEVDSSIFSSAFITLTAFTSKAFLGDEGRKERFICKYDGILLAGKDLVPEKEKFPKPGAELAYLLNKDYEPEVQSFREWVATHPDASQKQIGKKSKEVTRRTIDAIFGFILTNHALFVHSKVERAKKIMEFPDGNDNPGIFLDLLNSAGVGTLEQLGFLIDGLERVCKDLIEQLKPVIEKLEARGKKG